MNFLMPPILLNLTRSLLNSGQIQKKMCADKNLGGGGGGGGGGLSSNFDDTCEFEIERFVNNLFF